MIQIFKAKALLTRALIFSGLAIAAVQSPALAAPQDYHFDLDGQPTKSGKAMIVKIRLTHMPDGKPVSGAIITQAKLDMGPEGMAEMGAPANASATAEPGVYQVDTQLSMGGKWALTLAAKVQGETETVRGAVIVLVAK